MYIPTLYTGNKVGIIQVGSKEGKPMFFFYFSDFNPVYRFNTRQVPMWTRLQQSQRQDLNWLEGGERRLFVCSGCKQRGIKKWICVIVSFLLTGKHIQETLIAWVWILRVEQWNAVFGSEFPTRLTNRELWCSSVWSHEAFDLSFAAALGTGTTVRGAWGVLVDPEESGLAHPGTCSKVDDRVWWVTYRPNHRNQFRGRKLAASWF